MKALWILLTLIVAGAAPKNSSNPNQAPALEIKFIGNMAVQISDGQTTLLTDFPYKSGAFGYMTYNMRDVGPKGKVLCLITHEHDDHFDPALWKEKDWSLVASPLIKTENANRRLAFSDKIQFEDIEITPVKTPHTEAHFSYLVKWKGKQFYFTGDTEAPATLPKTKVDVLFSSPWLLKFARRAGIKILADKIVVYHHTSTEKVPTDNNEIVPTQGQLLKLF